MIVGVRRSGVERGKRFDKGEDYPTPETTVVLHAKDGLSTSSRRREMLCTVGSGVYS